MREIPTFAIKQRDERTRNGAVRRNWGKNHTNCICLQESEIYHFFIITHTIFIVWTCHILLSSYEETPIRFELFWIPLTIF
jgi:hypothetical protein